MRLPIIGVILGDAAGIGPEIVAKMHVEKKFQNYCRPVVIGDRRVLERGFSVIGEPAELQVIQAVAQADWSAGGLPVLDLPMERFENVLYGRLNADCGAACVQQIRTAVALYQKGEVQGVCYAPLNKGAMIKGGNPVESELELAAMLLGCQDAYCEINMVDNIWTTRVTSHVPLCEVSKHLSIEGITKNIALCNKTLLKAGYAHPRIGVAALNPHAGENGLCGREEIDLIAPAIKQAQELGINATGPYASDTLFVRAFDHKEFDGAVTMFHDQGQIALKLKGFSRGVTIGGGLDMPFTTCAHGTAFDIAGRGIASTTAFENAIFQVSKMAAND